MSKILPVPYQPQEISAGCLPACAQMVLAYLGVKRSQAEIARLVGTHPQAGTPYSRLLRLRSAQLDVAYQKASSLDDIANWLARDLPVIAFVQMRELPHWQGHWSQHAVVIVGLSAEHVHILDPAASAQVIAVPANDFLLAWSEMDSAYAALAVRGFTQAAQKE